MEQVQTTLPLESVVGERYQVEALLGKGGFGAVYLVCDLRVRHNLFALKEMIDPDQRARRHFATEAEILKHTDHPSLPRVYRVFDDPALGRAYILMDYIEGSNLEQLRRKRPGQRFALREALTLVGPVFEAIAYLHAQQPPIIHRDIKPSNIIAPDSGARTVLVDFGIAKEFDQEATTTAIRHASPGYGAPEQYSSGTNTYTDIYGLGATLYALLTGTIPVDSFFRLTQYLGKGYDPLPLAREIVPTIPEHVSEAIARAMVLENNQRFASVEDFWQALQPDALPIGPLPVLPPAAINGAGQRVLGKERNTRRAQAPLRAPSPSRLRGKWLVTLLLLLLALGAGFASALLVLSNQHAQQTSSATATPGIRATPTATATATATPTPTSTPTETPTPPPTATSAPVASIPTLVSMYTGTLHDNNGSINASMVLTGITQQGQAIQGIFNVGLPLQGNGPFTGTVNSRRTIQFTVHSSDPAAPAPLFFSGSIQKNGRMSGLYCSLDTTGHCNHNVGGFGTWFVAPAQ